MYSDGGLDRIRDGGRGGGRAGVGAEPDDGVRPAPSRRVAGEQDRGGLADTGGRPAALPGGETGEGRARGSRDRRGIAVEVWVDKDDFGPRGVTSGRSRIRRNHRPW